MRADIFESHLDGLQGSLAIRRWFAHEEHFSGYSVRDQYK